MRWLSNHNAHIYLRSSIGWSRTNVETAHIMQKQRLGLKYVTDLGPIPFTSSLGTLRLKKNKLKEINKIET